LVVIEGRCACVPLLFRLGRRINLVQRFEDPAGFEPGKILADGLREDLASRTILFFRGLLNRTENAIRYGNRNFHTISMNNGMPFVKGRLCAAICHLNY